MARQPQGSYRDLLECYCLARDDGTVRSRKVVRGNEKSGLIRKILELQLKRLDDEFDVECERERDVRDDSLFSGLHVEWMVRAVHEDGKHRRKSRFGLG